MVIPHFSPTRDGPVRVTASESKVTPERSPGATVTLAAMITPVCTPVVIVLNVKAVVAFSKRILSSSDVTVAPTAVAIADEAAIRVAILVKESPDSTRIEAPLKLIDSPGTIAPLRVISARWRFARSPLSLSRFTDAVTEPETRGRRLSPLFTDVTPSRLKPLSESIFKITSFEAAST